MGSKFRDGGAVGVLEGCLESCLLIMCTTIPVFGNFFPCCTRGKESEKAHWEGTREWVSYSCFYLSCRCNAFGPNANCLGHTRFIQIDLALLSGNGLLNVNFRINSTRAAQTVTLCLGEVGWGGGMQNGGGKGKLNHCLELLKRHWSVISTYSFIFKFLVVIFFSFFPFLAYVD